MNIIKLQNELKGIPDQALIGYVQNPTGEVPTYLALSELQRRKTMREKYQQQQAPETTVAEDLAAPPPMEQGIASAAPQASMRQAPMVPPQRMAEGGVAALDTGDMYDEQNFATGGIVAFDEGGEIKNNPDGGGVKYDDGTIGYPIGGYVAPAVMGAGRLGARGLSYLKNKALGTPKVTGPTMNLPTGAVTPVLEAGTRGFLTTPGTYIDTAVIGGILYGIDQYGGKTPITEQEASNITMQKLEADNLKSMQDHGAAREASGKGGYTYQPGESATKSASDTYFDTINQFMPKSSAADGIKSERLVYDPTLFTKDDEDPEAEFKKGADRFTKYMGDNEAVKNQAARLAAREAGLKERESQNIGMALLTGGLDVLSGTSPFAAVNFGRAKSGVEQYIRGADRLQDLREKIDDAGFALDQAKRAEQTAAFKYGDDDRRTARANKIANQREDRLYKLKTQEFNITTGLKEKELGLQGELVDIKRMDLAKDIAFGNRQLEMYENRIDKMDKATQAKYASIKQKGIIEANKYIQSNPPEVRALVKQFTEQGKKTYGNPEFDGQLNLIKQGIIGQYLNSMQDELGLTDNFANVPTATDLLNRKQIP